LQTNVIAADIPAPFQCAKADGRTNAGALRRGDGPLRLKGVPE
jgi:hypothetical protein